MTSLNTVSLLVLSALGGGLAATGLLQAPAPREQGGKQLNTVTVRYIVSDVESAAAFYTNHLGFAAPDQPPRGFAALARGNLRLLLSPRSGPGGASQPMPDGRKPEPGGWNRIQLEVEDIAAAVEKLRKAGVRFRNEIVSGIGGKQILLDDPSGNPIELFEPPKGTSQ
jgi:catechol 2,3-dioxygenase-like lactoylglutathione lyase family enzyme